MKQLLNIQNEYSRVYRTELCSIDNPSISAGCLLEITIAIRVLPANDDVHFIIQEAVYREFRKTLNLPTAYDKLR